jgi:hypothetical protein
MKRKLKGNKHMFTELHTRIDQLVYFVNVMDKEAKSSPFLQNKNRLEFEFWNVHDWKNLYAFKNVEAWIQFMGAMDDLARFYNRMYKKNYRFELYFKSYSKENIDELRREGGYCVLGVWDEIVRLADEGYVFCFFSTQRECHDPNHFLGYMMDNFYYDRGEHGHVTYNDFVENNAIVPIITDEKW